VQVGAEGFFAVVGPAEAVLQVGDGGGELGDLLEGSGKLGGAGVAVVWRGAGGSGSTLGFAVGSVIVSEGVRSGEVAAFDRGDDVLGLWDTGQTESVDKGSLLGAVAGRRLDGGGGEDDFKDGGARGAVGRVGACVATAEDGKE
jgi:hypothetical protein